jgi:hypothetical protein
MYVEYDDSVPVPVPCIDISTVQIALPSLLPLQHCALLRPRVLFVSRCICWRIAPELQDNMIKLLANVFHGPALFSETVSLRDNQLSSRQFIRQVFSSLHIISYVSSYYLLMAYFKADPSM